MLNNCTFVGRLTANPELRYTSEGVAVSNFTLAVRREYVGQNGKEVDYISMVAWRKLAEICAEYLAKGRLVAVVGKFRLRENEKNGRKYLNPEIVLDQVKFLDSRRESGSNDNNGSNNSGSEGLNDNIDRGLSGNMSAAEFNSDEIDVPF